MTSKQSFNVTRLCYVAHINGINSSIMMGCSTPFPEAWFIRQPGLKGFKNCCAMHMVCACTSGQAAATSKGQTLTAARPMRQTLPIIAYVAICLPS
jgi:hypothetical protein